MNILQLKTLLFMVVLVAVSAMRTDAQAPIVGGSDEKVDTIKAAIDIAKAAERKGDFNAAADAYDRILELDPHNYQAHLGLANIGKQSLMRTYQAKPGFGSDEKLMKELSDKLQADSEAKQAKYEKLAKENPNKAVYQLVLASNNAYEPVKMQYHLYEAQRLEPGNVDVLRQVAQFEKLKGNNTRAHEIYKKISSLDPRDENAAFAYYYSLSDVDYQQFRAKAPEFLKRFPESDRGAHLLYEIASKGSEADKAANLERLRTAFPPEKNQTSMSAMSDLFVTYLHRSPEKALSFAREILAITPEAGKKEWQGHIDSLTTYQDAESLIKAKRFADALSVLGKAKPATGSRASREMTTWGNILRARAEAANGQPAAAYDGLTSFYIKSPSDEVRRELAAIGRQLGKNETQIEADVQTGVAELATPFRDFSLALYDQDKNVSLVDYRGKVVLLNFWYPLCGPCHAEAPYIQKLVEKYGKDKFVVLAPNAFPNQDSLVLPFFEGNKYDFIPLKVPDAEFLKREYQIRGYPTNYLIDKKGNRVYETGNVSPERLRQIELMIEILLAQ